MRSIPIVLDEEIDPNALYDTEAQKEIFFCAPHENSKFYRLKAAGVIPSGFRHGKRNLVTGRELIEARRHHMSGGREEVA